MANTDDSKRVAAELTGAAQPDWDKTLARIRDAKGDVYTQGIVLALKQLDGDGDRHGPRWRNGQRMTAKHSLDDEGQGG